MRNPTPQGAAVGDGGGSGDRSWCKCLWLCATRADAFSLVPVIGKNHYTHGGAGECNFLLQQLGLVTRTVTLAGRRFWRNWL